MQSGPLQVYARGAPAFFTFLGVLSVVDFALGIAQAVRLSKEPVDDFRARTFGHGPNRAQIVFYCITVPLVSVILSIIDASFYVLVRDFRRIIASLVGAVLLLIGWICQMGIWTNCEELGSEDGGLSDFCPQVAMVSSVDNSFSAQGWKAETAKNAFGWIIMIGYFAYMTFVAVVVSKARSSQNHVMTPGGKENSQVTYESSIETK